MHGIKTTAAAIQIRDLTINFITLDNHDDWNK